MRSWGYTIHMPPHMICAGAKKVQQDLARPGVLERFVQEAQQAELMRSFFAGLWGLDDLAEPDTAAIVQVSSAAHDWLAPSGWGCIATGTGT
jgi:hypothetical protein